MLEQRPIEIVSDPIALFAKWAHETENSGEDATMAALATADAEGFPSVRIVLVKDVSKKGFCVFTNLTSRKACNMKENPKASLCFHWRTQQRQVRVSGAVESVSAFDADEYFLSRARESQLGAWASKQSQTMESSDDLSKRMEKMRALYEGKPVPRPDFWSGFRIIPERIEFWQEGKARLHTRICYIRIAAGEWQHSWLYP
jgi:pyridoxamine 5'-phosphate oxidase